jgi:FG-GAP repeat protein
MRRSVFVSLLALVLASLWPGAQAALAASNALGDFNGDGRSDLAVAVPQEDVAGVNGAGAVNVLYGDAFGLSTAGNQFWHQNSAGVLDVVETGDLFGRVAAGDFNGDGRADLAVGVANEDVGTITDAGAVNVLYGTASGLSATGNQFWHQNSAGVLDAAEPFDRFGNALVAGDFNNDARADLAVAAHQEDVGTANQAGAVNVLYGSPSGLSSTGNQLWHQDSPAVPEGAEENDSFGSALAAGDFNNDGRADLAAGVSGEGLGTADGAGAVNTFYGTASGLAASDTSQLWHQDRPGMLDVADAGDQFGFALAAGDFNGNGRDDLAVGVPKEDRDEFDDGAVNVLYGGASGLSATGNQLWHQNSPGVLDVAELDDDFGGRLAAGDFNGNGRDDLAIGVEDESVDAVPGAGAVNVLYGTATALSATGNQLWHQNSPGVLDSAETLDVFGHALAAGDFDGNGRFDLAVGVSFENIGAVDAGVVNVLYGTPSALSEAGNQFWHQNVAGVLDFAEGGDQFGDSLASGVPASGPS